VKSEVNKNTCVRNADEKQPFLDGQIEKFDSGMVTGIETPNPHFSKNNIPNYKENCGQDYGRKNRFPSFDILHPVFETIQKGNN
jgi:hypothetical protein